MGSLPQATQTFDVLIIGSGLSGLCSLYHIRKRFPDWRVKVLDAAPDVGGTWYWNSYPGCRFDSESLSYCFSFDKELLDEWHWKEAFSPQPETHKYITYFAEKHSLYKDIQFSTTVKHASWSDADHTWTFVDENGNRYVTTFFISCMGFLSAPTLPAVEGIEDFQGKLFHTSRWPRDLDVSRGFSGKRVGVIGTGATGIQIITAISKQPDVKSVSVFQRTANWSAPLRNSEISVEQMAKFKKEYDSIFDICAKSSSGFMHQADPRKSLEVTEEERLALWEKLYNEPGFGKWLGVFSDTYTDRYANGLYSKFMAEKIRQRVDDPAVAESLIPKNHGYGDRAIWVDHRPSTFLGVTAPAMPNMFMILGPHQPFGNATRSIEHATMVICDLLQHCKDKGYSYVEPTQEAVDRWTDHVVECSKSQTLMNEIDSWMTGVNKNVKGKTVRSVARYSGSAIEYRRWCEETKKSGYRAFAFA
ncbi:hypothetical protein ACJZ2D_002876 [Fusarium nematophilum]